MAKATKFRDLYTSQAFTFWAEQEFTSMAKGPWVKVGARSYRSLKDGHADGPTITVGTTSARVEPHG